MPIQNNTNILIFLIFFFTSHLLHFSPYSLFYHSDEHSPAISGTPSTPPLLPPIHIHLIDFRGKFRRFFLNSLISVMLCLSLSLKSGFASPDRNKNEMDENLKVCVWMEISIIIKLHNFYVPFVPRMASCGLFCPFWSKPKSSKLRFGILLVKRGGITFPLLFFFLFS